MRHRSCSVQIATGSSSVDFGSEFLCVYVLEITMSLGYFQLHQKLGYCLHQIA